MLDCKKCENYGFIICDTNFLIYIMDFIFQRNSNTDKDFLTQLGQFLSWIIKCSINGKINVSKVLYNDELNTTNRLSRGRDVSIVHNSFFFKKYKNHPKINYRLKIKKIFNKYIKIFQLNPKDLVKIETIAKSRFPSKTPSKDDLSLILLGLKESTNQNFRSILITEDMRSKIILEKDINRLPQFRCDKGNIYETKNIISKGYISFLLPIYNDCKFKFIRELIKFYENEQNRFVRNVWNPDTLKEKLRLSNSSASNIADYIYSKLKFGGKIIV